MARELRPLAEAFGSAAEAGAASQALADRFSAVLPRVRSARILRSRMLFLTSDRS